MADGALQAGYTNAALVLAELLDFVAAFSEPRLLDGAITAQELTRDEAQRFLEIDTRLFVALHLVGLDRYLPSIEDLGRELDRYGPPVMFLGKSRLPGDWEDGVFAFGTNDWLVELKPLREILKTGSDARTPPESPSEVATTVLNKDDLREAVEQSLASMKPQNTQTMPELIQLFAELSSDGEHAMKLTKIISDDSKSTNLRMTEACELSPDLYLKKSPWWANLFGVEQQAITKTDFWKRIRKDFLDHLKEEQQSRLRDD